jgi:N-carbamoyl-L-amino-acid hydrolase
VATVGTLEVRPGAINSIPSQVELGIDVRDIDGERRDRVLRAIEERARGIAARRGVTVVILPLNADAPARCDERVRAQIVAACDQLGIAHRELISRAYHDALFMAALAPTAMIFVPCRGGVSHRPDEHVEPSHLKMGAEVLAGTLVRLAEGMSA